MAALVVVAASAIAAAVITADTTADTTVDIAAVTAAVISNRWLTTVVIRCTQIIIITRAVTKTIKAARAKDKDNPYSVMQPVSFKMDTEFSVT
jgi:hypothetical protein